MAGDTSLYFTLVPVDLGVGRMMRKAAADVGILNAANKSSSMSMEKVAGSANKASVEVERLGVAGKSNLSKVSTSARGAASDMERAGQKVNKAFADMSLSAKRGSAQIDQSMQKVSRSAATHSEKTAKEFFKIDNAVRNTGRRWASMGLLIGGLVVGLLGHVVAFTDALWQTLGVLAAVPAVAFGAAVGLGSLLLIFKGLLPAMKQAGGGGASAADQIAQATHRLEQAQRSANQAQQDLNDAREQATRDLQDMSRELAKASLDERSGVLAVREAEQNLRQVRARGGTRDEREAAQIAYEQAVISLDEIREKNADLQKQEADRAAKGVEGSDEVQQALQRQQDALYELAQAQKAMANPSGGGGSAAAAAYAKLSTAGKQLVDTLKSVGKAWGGVQKDVQQAGLANVAGDVQYASDGLLKQRGYLVGIAAAWNTAFRSVLGYFGSVEATADLNVALGNTVGFSQHLAAAWVPFIRGFMDFVTAGSAYLPRFGAWIEKLAVDFARWANDARSSGKIADWIERGAKAAADLGHWIRDISGGIGQIFKAGNGGPQYMENLAAAAKKWRDNMGSPEMQSHLATFFASSRDLGSSLWKVIKDIADAITNMPGVIKEATGALNIFGWFLKFAADHAGALNVALPVLLSYFATMKILDFAKGINGVVAALKEWKIVQIALDVELWASPIGIIILAVVALAAIFAILWNKVAAFRDFWKAVWENIKTVFLTIWNAVKPALTDLWHTLSEKGKQAWETIKPKLIELRDKLAELGTKIQPLTHKVQNLWDKVKPIAILFGKTLLAAIVAVIWVLGKVLPPVIDVVVFLIGGFIDGLTALIGWVERLPGYFGDAWDWVKKKTGDAKDWIVDKWNGLVDFFKGLPEKIGTAAKGMWDGIKDGLRAALNWMIDQWNKLDFGIHIHLPSWAGGYGFDINDIFPDIPRLASGGTVTSGGMAMVGEKGPETVLLPRGASVIPNGGGGGGTTTLVVQSGGSKMDDFVVELIRRYVRVQGGGNVQAALGRAGR